MERALTGDEALVGFGRALRDEGVRVGTDRIVQFCTAAALVEPTELYWAGRATLVSRPADVAAYDRAAADVFDWDGGTRIGGSLRRFLDRWGHQGLARGAVVVICSDGLDVGDPELLQAQMARLGRLAHRVVWLNP